MGNGVTAARGALDAEGLGSNPDSPAFYWRVVSTAETPGSGPGVCRFESYPAIFVVQFKSKGGEYMRNHALVGKTN
jgi:hypothetical protein